MSEGMEERRMAVGIFFELRLSIFWETVTKGCCDIDINIDMVNVLEMTKVPML